MPKAIIMPKFEMAQERGTVAAWLKQNGEHVEKGEPLLEVETDKINMEVESPASGTLFAISAQPGESVQIGAVIAQLLLPGETLPEVAPVASDLGPRLTPVAKRVAASHGIDPQQLPNHGERLTKADIEQLVEKQASSVTQLPITQLSISQSPSGKSSAVPAARRLARELGVDLASVRGSGPDGRIQSHDVQQTADQHVAPVAAPETAPISTTDQLTIRRQVPLTAMRRTIAERLTASWQTIPQFTLSRHVDMTRAQQVIDEVRAVLGDTPRVTITALLVKACAWALARHPAVNASFAGEQISEWAEINVGVAVAVEAGLVVPVIHHADQLRLPVIAAQLQAVGERARNNKLIPTDLRGGTFTISNLGMLGVENFTAIINPPQAAILAVGQTIKQVVVEGEDGAEQSVIKPLANFTLSADHRVIDGALAARFLADLKQVLEKPSLLL